MAFVRRDWHWLVRFARPELGMLPHSLGRGRIERTFWALFADRDLVDPSVADIVVDEFERIYRSPGARLAFLASARAIYLEPPFGRKGFYPRLAALQPPALFVWASHDRLIPEALPPPRRALAAERRAGRARGLRPRAAGRAPGAHERPAGALLRPRRPARRRRCRLTGRRMTATLRMAATADLVQRRRGARSSRRVPAADLDERDPDYIRETLPRLWLLASLYFRGEVRGLGNVPEEGPVLLVGNHSGGNLTPDTTVFTLAFSTYFGVERAFHQLAHNLVLSMPGLSLPAQVRDGRGLARRTPARRCEAGAAVLVYPGGDYEVHRPSWERNRVDFGGRKGFIRLALEQDVPIVPVVGDRRPGDRAVPLARRAPRRGRCGSTGCSA